jgi:dihydrolipoamide dehydrogenase
MSNSPTATVPAASTAGSAADICIIGAGPGGYRAAEYAAKQGLQVVIIEQDEVGGTCLNRGCIPTKTYVHSATFAEAFERQQQVVAQLRAGVEGILSAPNITLLRGHAFFVDASTVTVTTTPAASAAGTLVTAKNIIIATGSSAKLLPLPDINDPRLVTSTELLQLQTLPKRLCIIGAGVIGMEFASVFQRFGSEVTVIEYLKECLPMLDSDIAKRLRKLLEKRGITFKLKTAVERLSDIDADVILMATGRKANTEGLNLEAAGIILAPNGTIPVDDNFRIATTPVASAAGPATTPVASAAGPATTPVASAAGLYAIGDVNGRQMLAHAAEMQAVRAVNHILGREDGIRFDIMPSAIFTEPEAACVGSVEGNCRKAFWRANGKALAMGESEGMLKLFSDDNDRITGCHAFGAHAADMVQEVAALMCRDTTVAQLRDMIHIHPTLGEILHTAAE